MKRYLLLCATALVVNFGAQSQTVDVTETYIPNAGFEDCEALPTKLVHDNTLDVDVNVVECFNSYSEARGTDYSDNGWTLVEQLTGANGGVINYTKTDRIQHKSYNAAGDATPTQGPTGTSGVKGLVFQGNKSVVYRQASPITLPAGRYTLTVNVWACNGGTTNPSPTYKASNVLTGFMPEDGTSAEDLIPAYKPRSNIEFKSNGWDKDVITIELDKATTGYFQLCYGSTYFIVVDDLKLEYEGGVITTTLVKAIAKAKALNAKLNSTDLADAIGDAETFAANPTTQEDVPIQVEMLYSAMATALSAAEDVIDITEAYVENHSFESGELAPWEWAAASGYVDTPLNEGSLPYIDGSKIAYFTTSGQNNITQTISNLPEGYYIVEARLSNGKAKIAFGSSSAEYTGPADVLFLHASSPATHFDGGSTTIGVKGSVGYRVDDFHLYYAKTAAALDAVVLEHNKADARQLLDDPNLDIVTGSERTALQEAISTGVSVYALSNAFYKAQTDYAAFEKAKNAALAYDKELYPYGKESLYQQIEDMISTEAQSATHASLLASQLAETCFDFYVSNSYCEGVERTDYTDHIVGANATTEPKGWGVKNMTVRTDKTGWTDPKTGEKDAVVYGVTTDYYRACKDEASILKQTLTGLPAGKYVLSMTAMGSNNLVINVFFNNLPIGEVKTSGTSGGGKYGAGWNDYLIPFTKSSDADMPLQLQCKPAANYQDWYVDNFRLYLLSDTGDGISDNMVNRTLSNGKWYDLSGRQVQNPVKGIYIQDGKKVIRK